MEHRGDADLRAQMPGIGGDGGERLSDSAEQDRIDGGLVWKAIWEEEDNVGVRHRRQFGLSMREPFGACLRLTLGTMLWGGGEEIASIVADVTDGGPNLSF